MTDPKTLGGDQRGRDDWGLLMLQLGVHVNGMAGFGCKRGVCVVSMSVRGRADGLDDKGVYRKWPCS
jgi:hypothetical protein